MKFVLLNLIILNHEIKKSCLFVTFRKNVYFFNELNVFNSNTLIEFSLDLNGCTTTAAPTGTHVSNQTSIDSLAFSDFIS